MKIKIVIASVSIYIILYSVLMGFILYTKLDLSDRFLIPSYDLFTSQGNFVVMGYPMNHLILCFPLANIMFIGLISILIGINIVMFMNQIGKRSRLWIRFSIFLIGICIAFFTNDGLCGYPFFYFVVPNISVALSKNTLLFMVISSSLLLLNVIPIRFFGHKLDI